MFTDPTQPRRSLWDRWLFGPAGAFGLLVLYLVLGLVGHEPWRGADFKHFLPVWQVLTGAFLPEALLNPALQPWGPLYSWVGAALANVATAWGLTPADGSRLGQALWWCTAALLLYRALSPRDRRWALTAVLLFAGALGWVAFAHVHSSVVALVFAAALALGSYAPQPRAQRVGTGMLALAFAFWSAGGSGVLFVAALALPAAWSARLPLPRALAVNESSGALRPAWLCFAWRFLGAGAGLVTLMALVRCPAVADWAASTTSVWDWPWTRLTDWAPRLVGWSLWPLWLVVLWPPKIRRLFAPEVRSLALAALLATVVLLSAFPAGDDTALLLAPVLATLAAWRLLSFGPSTLSGFVWFSRSVIAVLIVLIALVASAQLWDWPPGLARHVARTAPELELPDAAVRLGLAGLILAAWAVLSWRLPREAIRAAGQWFLSVALVWALLVILALPWVDHTRNPAPLVRTLAAHPTVVAHGCVAIAANAPLDVLAAWRYHAPSIRVAADCPLHLARRWGTKQSPTEEPALVTQAWRGEGKNRETWQIAWRHPPGPAEEENETE